MSFYEQLAAETADARNTLLSSPIVADCLRGEVSLPSYLAFLGQAFHHVRHTTPLLMSLGGKLPKYKFGHLAEHRLPSGLVLFDSYHCSRYNQNTGRLTAEMFDAVFARALERRNG